ncbi:hypothetical protein RFM41_18840 [Mesorhizobium sp. VK25A]|uniref:Uncharacterized protein n=1 Tax=Mesorhizobium vachelliae TaxID=3072309 RepID=A0ABU4ZYV5_9HYPH|nr:MULTISPECIES: hypothetical protein [unclassified Mesorhizobium]MDX8529602.1 hypothetical protein [Mesorhizobium sp. VK25D]MDX8545812.1 hypothetical protein [Mesorhizobium sp. VK25A]
MDGAPVSHDVFVHVRIILGMVLGLSMTPLVTGLTRFVQHPKREQIYPIHIAWAVFMLLAITHFWWFEFGLSSLQGWTFEVYFFLILYTILFAVLSALLFPDRMDEYKGFEDYFQSRRQWFYGSLTLIFLFDFVDTLIKGVEHFRSLGMEYPVRQVVFALCSAVAVIIPSKRYQGAFVTIGLIYQVSWILRQFEVLK